MTDSRPPATARAWSRLRPIIHAVVVVFGFSVLFGWVYGRALFSDVYLIESDLYEYFLPIFLSPITQWSGFEFSGLPAFADPGDNVRYPLHFFFSRIVGSWAGFVTSAFVLTGALTYAYVYNATRSICAALFAGVAFALSETMMERLAHMGVLHAMPWLPLTLLAIDRLRGPHWRRWIAVGAVAVASYILAGHPQPAVYISYLCGFYALTGGIAERARLRFYVSVAAVFALGGLLAAFKLLPLVEASEVLARDRVGLGQFASHANTTMQMWSALFPTVVHDGREAPLYVGLATLILGLVGVVGGRAWWRAGFWTVAVVVCLLLGSGELTPLTQWAFEYVPLYDKFRISARHLLLACFGATILAGLGVHAVLTRPRLRLAAIPAVLVVAAAMWIGIDVFQSAPAGLVFEHRNPFSWNARGWSRLVAIEPIAVSDALWTQLAIGAATAALALLAAAVRRPAPVMMALALVVAVDLLNAQPVAVSARGVDSDTMPTLNAEPSVHALAVARDLAASHQRVLAIGGTHRDAVVPATWTRHWGIASAGGYGPMLLARYSELATMGTNGSVRTSLLAAGDVALDLLAVRQIIVQPDDVASQGTFERDGLQWEKSELRVAVGVADCGPTHERRATLPLLENVAITAIALVGHLRCAEDVRHGTEIGTITVIDEDGTAIQEYPLRAGVDVAEYALAEPSVLARARHRPARRFDDPDTFEGNQYLINLTLPAPAKVRRLELRTAGFPGWMALHRLTLVDADGRPRPQTAAAMHLANAARWKDLRRFRTSRQTDRGTDQDDRRESAYAIFENQRAMPRAWLVPAVLSLPDVDLLTAIRISELPDGAPFDPRRVALVEEGTAIAQTNFDTRAATVSVVSIRDSRIELNVSSEGGGYLVLSESSYPGWHARVDGADTPIYRTNYALQGTIVPAGNHQVVFELVPRSAHIGLALSVLAAIAVAVLAASRKTDDVAAR